MTTNVKAVSDRWEPSENSTCLQLCSALLSSAQQRSHNKLAVFSKNAILTVRDPTS